MIENGVARAVSLAIRRRLANRTWSCGPQITIGVIAQKHTIARRVAHRVVVPRGDTIEEAVRSPGYPASPFTHAESPDGIPDDIDPRCGRKVAARQMDLVFAVLVEAAQTIERLKSSSGVRRLCVNRHRTKRYDVAIHDLELGWISVLDTGELEEISESEAVAIHLDPSHRLEERDLLRLEEVRPSDEDAAWSIEQTSFARCHGRSQKLVAQLLHVAGWMHVENHEIASGSLQSPVMVSSEQLSNARHSYRTFDRGQKDWPITGNPEAPQLLLAESVLFDRALGRSETRMRQHQIPRQVLIQCSICWR